MVSVKFHILIYFNDDFSLDHILCEDKEMEVSGMAPMSMLPLIQYFFFELAVAGSFDVLQESEIFTFIADEIVCLNQLDSWNKVNRNPIACR